MNYRFLEEPLLQFADDDHICPRFGISSYKVYDAYSKTRRKNINLGIVCAKNNIEKTIKWLEQCKTFILGKNNSRQPNLFPSFCGFNKDSGFLSEMIIDSDIIRDINNSEIKKVLSIEKREERIIKAVDLFYDQVEFLAQQKSVDVILIVIPQTFETKIVKRSAKSIEPNIDDEDLSIETDFRRALKARAMHLARPLQLIKEHSLTDTPSVQDAATRAWNFCTALYYKANGTPWKLKKDDHEPPTCFVGVSFYRSRDKETLQTSLAQLFDELGRGVILRGTPIENKSDRRPHLNDEDAYALLLKGLTEYKKVLGNLPARLVMHKSSNFSNEEIEGFSQAIGEMGITTIDFVTILDSEFRLFRTKLYPPYRGSVLEVESNRSILYTRGSVEYYESFPGIYIPQPIEIRLIETDESSIKICSEILALTKLNWNNTQIDGKYPITLSSAREVGKILKYLGQEEEPQTRYSYYM